MGGYGVLKFNRLADNVQEAGDYVRRAEGTDGRLHFDHGGQEAFIEHFDLKAGNFHDEYYFDEAWSGGQHLLMTICFMCMAIFFWCCTMKHLQARGWHQAPKSTDTHVKKPSTICLHPVSTGSVLREKGNDAVQALASTGPRQTKEKRSPYSRPCQWIYPLFNHTPDSVLSRLKKFVNA